VLYDDFKTPFLDPDRWFGTEEPERIVEVFRGTSSNRLVMENRAYGKTHTNDDRTRNTLSLHFRDATVTELVPGQIPANPDVTAIRATVKVDALEQVGCATNATPTRSFARLSGDFFNTRPGGAIGPGNATGDVFAAIGLERDTDPANPPDVIRVIAVAFFCTNPRCTAGTLAFRQLGTTRTRKDVVLLIQWDQQNNGFIFQRDNGTPEFIGYEEFIFILRDPEIPGEFLSPGEVPENPPGRPVQGLTVQHFVANCDMDDPANATRPVAWMRAFFGNVFVNESAAP